MERAEISLRERAARVVVGAVLALGAWACDRAPSSGASSSAAARPPRLVILYATCTVRKDHLAPYDRGVEYTPNLAAFARDAWVFQRHTTEAEQSGPAFASIFAGAQADRHRVFHHPRKLDPALELVCEAFAAAGYETWFWSGHPMASYRLNYGQGVALARVVSHGVAERGRITEEEKLGLSANDPKFDALLDDLRARPEARAFVQVNFTLTHGPYWYYTTPEAIAAFCARFPSVAGGLTPDTIAKYAALHAENHLELQWDHAATVRKLGLSDAEVRELARAVDVTYAATIHELDRMFGMFLERIKARGLWDDTLLAFTADHGEVLYRDNALYPWTHGLQLAPESLDVPLVMRVPGAKGGAHPGVSRSIDVYPTLAGLSGVALPAAAGIEGVDLAPVLRGEAADPGLAAYSHGTTFSNRLMEQMQEYAPVTRYFSGGIEDVWVRVRRGDTVGKLRKRDDGSFGVEVFDLAADPEERRDLYSDANAEHRAIAADLAAYKARLVAAHAGGKDPRALDDAEELQRLRALGYVK